MAYRVLNTVVVALFLARSGALAADQRPRTAGSKRNQPGADMICGPRCVQFLVKWYQNKDEDLIELAREVQWPQVEAGSTLDAVDQALRRRGIHTYPMRLSPSAVLQWRHPAVVRVSPSATSQTKDAPAHFAVWLPSSANDECWVWNGPSGVERFTEASFARRRSGEVLLTSSEPIQAPEEAVASAPVWWHLMTGGFILVVLGLCLLLSRWKHG